MHIFRSSEIVPDMQIISSVKWVLCFSNKQHQIWLCFLFKYTRFICWSACEKTSTYALDAEIVRCKEILTQRLSFKVYSNSACNSISNYERWRSKVVGTDTVTETSFKVLCSRQHSTGNYVTLKGRPIYIFLGLCGTSTACSIFC